MSYKKRSKRDGSGPYKGSPRKIGRRKQAGIPCPVKRKK